MSESTPPGQAGDEPLVPSSRVSFERLRERTDELELLISGLITFVLLSLPDWIAGVFADVHIHLTGALAHISLMAAAIAIGLCVTLGICFLLHLLVRAYWVGLIGLKSVYPHGIRWDRLPGAGPIGRAQLRERYADMYGSIDRVDRFASSLFAVISLATILILWAVLLQIVVAATAGALGLLLGGFERAVMWVLWGLMLMVLVPTAVIYLLDVVLATRHVRVRESPRVVALVRALRTFMASLVPERLIVPVQLTLSSNTRPKGFMLAMVVGSMLVPVVGIVYLQQSRSFAGYGDYRYFATAELDESGFDSAHYESLRGHRDRMRMVPMLASDQVDTPFLRLFIPYHPARDNPRLAELCPDLDIDAQGAAAACLRQLWQVELDGRAVSLQVFSLAQRTDLGMRGLLGYVALGDATPGPYRLVLRRQQSEVEQAEPSRRQRKTSYSIPFLYAPEPGS